MLLFLLFCLANMIRVRIYGELKILASIFWKLSFGNPRPPVRENNILGLMCFIDKEQFS